MRLKSIEAAKKHLEEQKAIRESEIDLTKAEFDNLIAVLEAGGASKERIAEAQSEFDKHIQAERLNSELQFQQGLLALTGAGDEAQIAQIKNKIALIKTELEGLALPDAPEADKPKQGLLERLGFDEDQISELRRAAGDIKSILDDITGAQVDQAEHEIELAQKRFEAEQRGPPGGLRPAGDRPRGGDSPGRDAQERADLRDHAPGERGLDEHESCPGQA